MMVQNYRCEKDAENLKNGTEYWVIKGYYHLPARGYQMEPHSHKNWEIMFAYQGSFSVFINDDEIQLDEKQFIFIRPDVMHRIYVRKPQNCVVTNLEFASESNCAPNDVWMDTESLCRLQSANSNFSSFLFRSSLPYIVYQDKHNIYSSLRELIAELQEKNYILTPLVRVMFLRLLMEIALRSTPVEKERGIRYIRDAKEYITKHYSEKLTTREIALNVGISSDYLLRLFTKYEKNPISQHILACRMEEAAFLLKNSKKPVTDIAFEVGYNSRQSFHRAFLLYYRVNPSDFRKANGVIIPYCLG